MSKFFSNIPASATPGSDWATEAERRVPLEVRIERPSSLGQLDALRAEGLERIELNPDRGKEGIALVFSVEPGDAERFRRAFVRSCEEAGLHLASPEPNLDATAAEDEAWDIRGW